MWFLKFKDQSVYFIKLMTCAPMWGKNGFAHFYLSLDKGLHVVD
jgi:hypothetical protein